MLAENPILTLRKQDGLSRVELAKRLGLAYSDVTQLENGYLPRLPRRMVRALDEYGRDGAQAAQDYLKWRETTRKEA